MVDEENRALYEKLINKFYGGDWDYFTMDYIIRRRTIEMRLQPLPFQQIGDGEKTIELRLYDEKRRKIQVGNCICFTNTENAEMHIQARVVALHRYDTFEELLKTDLFEECGCAGMSVAEATEMMYAYYTPEEEKKWGVLGIEINVIERNI